VPVAVASVTGPGMSALAASGLHEEGFRQTLAAMRASLLLLVPSVLVLVFFAGDAMAVFGTEFVAHRDLLRILAISLIAAPMIHSGAGTAVALGAFRTYLASSLVFVAIALVLAALLIPWLGLPGAAAAMSGGAFVRQLVLGFALRRHVGFPRNERQRAAWCCVVAALAVGLVLDPGRLAGAGLVLLFLSLFAWWGGVTRGELAALLRRGFGRD